MNGQTLHNCQSPWSRYVSCCLTLISDAAHGADHQCCGIGTNGFRIILNTATVILLRAYQDLLDYLTGYSTVRSEDWSMDTLAFDRPTLSPSPRFNSVQPLGDQCVSPFVSSTAIQALARISSMEEVQPSRFQANHVFCKHTYATFRNLRCN